MRGKTVNIRPSRTKSDYRAALKDIEGLHRTFGIPAESLLKQRVGQAPAANTRRA